MPCYDSRSDDEDRLNRKMVAVLCGIASSIGADAIEQIVDWREVGVTTKEFREWWKQHEAVDKARRNYSQR